MLKGKKKGNKRHEKIEGCYGKINLKFFCEQNLQTFLLPEIKRMNEIKIRIAFVYNLALSFDIKRSMLYS